MSARIIDGKAAAADVRARVAEVAADFTRQTGRQPGLATVLVGEDPASAVYVRSKGKATAEAAMASFAHKLPDTTSEDELLDLVERLNRDDSVDGILVQLPLPPKIDASRVIAAIRIVWGTRGRSCRGRLIRGMLLEIPLDSPRLVDSSNSPRSECPM